MSEGKKNSKNNPIIFTPQQEFEVWKGLNHLMNKFAFHLMEWKIRARLLGASYNLAFHRFSNALKDREDWIEWENGLLSDALSVLSSGLLGDIGEMMEKEMGLWGGIEDAIQTAANLGIQKGFQIDVSKFERINVFPDKHPTLYQDSLLLYLDMQWFEVQKKFLETQNLINDKNQPEFKHFTWDYWDKTINAKLANNRFCNPPKITLDYSHMALDFETYFWACWCKENLNKSTLFNMLAFLAGVPVKWLLMKKPTSPVEWRLNALKITEAAKVGDFGWWTSQEEIQKVIDWAFSFLENPIRTAYDPKVKIDFRL